MIVPQTERSSHGGWGGGGGGRGGSVKKGIHRKTPVLDALFKKVA